MEADLKKGDGFHFEGIIHLPNKTERCIEVNGRLQSQPDGSGAHHSWRDTRCYADQKDRGSHERKREAPWGARQRSSNPPTT